MGLTHFWRPSTELPLKAFADAVKNIQQVVKVADIPLAGFEGEGQPVFLNDGVVFNGVAGAACEPFEIHQIEFDRRGRQEKFSFCKTEGLPYDIAVKAALVVLKHHLGESIKIMSDESDDAWGQACQIAAQAIGTDSHFKLDPKS